jgi:ATP-binding cassette subfamily B (MDR/TAP) protein 1
MTLLFGTLTQDFVNFSVVLEQVKAGNADAQAQVSAAAAAFRHAAAKDATWLVCIGEPN